MAMPSSSVGPDVICSGAPFGKRCRQVWKEPPALELKYIHLPSGDQAANVHATPCGPTECPAELPSIGTRRQGSQAPSISTISAHFPYGAGGVCEPGAGYSPECRRRPGIPLGLLTECGVRDPGAIRGEHRAQLVQVIVC